MNDDLISRSALLGELQSHKEGLRIVFEGLKDGVEKRISSAEICGALEAIIRANNAPAVDAVERKKLIKKLFPMGVPNTREGWDYAINARAVYEAIMKMED